MPAKQVIRTRAELSEFWLPWCVDAEAPWRTTSDHDPPAGHPRAAQLRLTDLTEPVIERALAGQPVDDGRSRSWMKIEQLKRAYEELGARGELVVIDGAPGAIDYDQPTFMTYNGTRMLCEGCHRASALWLSSVADFKLRLAEWPPAWPGYDNDEIRVRGRPFAEQPTIPQLAANIREQPPYKGPSTAPRTQRERDQW